MIPSFKYLGWVLSSADNDWPALVQNLARAQKVLWRMTSILNRGRGGARPCVSRFFFKAFVQPVLLFGA